METFNGKIDPEDDTGEVLSTGFDSDGMFIIVKLHVSQRILKIRQKPDGDFPVERMQQQ